MDLTSKIVLVTGGSRGLGRAMALAFARRGARVLINYVTSEEAASEVVQEIRRSGGEAQAYRADVARSQEIRTMAEAIEAQFGSIDILINNAGQIIRPGGWSELSDSDLDRTIDVNLKSVMHMLRVFVPGMIEKRSGRIINLTSTYGFTGAAAVFAYTAAKAGIVTVTSSMARELGQYGITVNAIAPGNIDTDMTRAAGPDVIKWAESTTPLGRLGRPDEIANAALFLAESDFITGHVLVVDGGQLLNM